MAAGNVNVSVIIATADRPAMLRVSIESVIRQTRAVEQIVVVDDGSSASAADVCNSFSNVHCVSSGGRGISAARNLGLRHARGNFIVVQDDDDIMLPNRIADHVQGFGTGADVSFGGWVNFSAQALGGIVFRPANPQPSLTSLLAGSANIAHGAAAYSRSLLARFPYDETLVVGCDMDLHARLLAADVSMRHTGSYVLLRRLHPESMTETRTELQRQVKESLKSKYLIAPNTPAQTAHSINMSFSAHQLEERFSWLEPTSPGWFCGILARTLSDAVQAIRGHLNTDDTGNSLLPMASKPGFITALIPFAKTRDVVSLPGDVRIGAVKRENAIREPDRSAISQASQLCAARPSDLGLDAPGYRIVLDISALAARELVALNPPLAAVSSSWRFVARDQTIDTIFARPVRLSMVSNRFTSSASALRALDEASRTANAHAVRCLGTDDAGFINLTTDGTHQQLPP
jgi:glycosyltransferase involved in cell wall biosynthesis